VAQAHALGPERLGLAGLDGGGVGPGDEILQVEPMAGRLGRLRPRGLQGGLGRAALAPRLGHRGRELVRAGIAVEQLELAGRLGQPAGLVLRRDLEQPLAQRLEVAARARPPPHQRPAAAAREQPPGDDERVLAVGAQAGHRLELRPVEEPVGQLELGLDVGLLAVRAHEPRRRLRAREQPDGLGQHRLARARLAREHVQTGGGLEVGALDQRQVVDVESEQHPT
jgi:hypothetical protein